MLGPKALANEMTMACAFHFIVVPYPCEVVGYHLAAYYGDFGDPETQLPSSGTEGRFWIHSADTDTLMPYFVLPNSDTAKNDGGTYEVNLEFTSSIWQNPYLDGFDFTGDIMLANPVKIETPGVYWIGSLITSTGTGQFVATTVSGMQRGLKDLVFTGSTPDNGDPFVSWEIPHALSDENTVVVEEFFPNINIWLICQPLTPEVPYGG